MSFLIDNIKLTRKRGLNFEKPGEAEKPGGEMILLGEVLYVAIGTH